MPGLHLYCDLEGGLGRKGDLALRAAGSLLNEPWFKLKTLVSSRGTFLAATYHRAYPVVTFENDEFFICLEGRIYGMSERAVDKTLSRIASLLYPGGSPCLKGNLRSVAGSIESLDGEFLLVVRHKSSGHVTVLNDSLGRLPTYKFEDRSRLIVSRDIRFLLSMLGRVEIDRDALASYLLLGFVPGKGSLVKGIERVQPCSIVRAGDTESMRTFDIGIRKNRGKDIDICASDLVGLFCGAAEARGSGGGPNVLALSGGLDSRSVAAALSKVGTPFETATFLDHFGTAAADVEVARHIAGMFGAPWRLFEPGQADGADVLRLLKAKTGDNFLGMSFSVPLFDSIRETWGDEITYLTGEGGGLTLPDIRPYGRMESVEELSEHILARNSVLSAAQVAEITGQPEDFIRDSFTSIIASYPETDLKDRYVHFIIRERDMRWTFDAEDRNRSWFWSSSPFQSGPFFDYVMNCTDEMKSDHSLYRRFMTRLSPEAAAVTNVNWNTSLVGGRYGWYMRARKLYYRMPPALKTFVRRRVKRTTDVVGPYPEDSALMRCFRDQIEGCPEIGEHISVPWVKHLLPSVNKYGFDHIFTVTSLLEELLTGRSTLEDYRDSDLI